MPINIIGSSIDGRFLDGVYYGQVVPIPLSDSVTQIGPNIITYWNHYDSINMEAYFDPDQSERYRSFQGASILSYLNDRKITYIQIGCFFMNGMPLPVTFHMEHGNYPYNDELFHPGDIGSAFWVDINRQHLPYYPNWTYEQKQNLNEANLFYYPQANGSFTIYPEYIQNYRYGAYQCAYLNKNVNLQYQDIPTDIPNYLENYDLNGLLEFDVFDEEMQRRLRAYTGNTPIITEILQYLISRSVIPSMAAQRERFYIPNTGYYKRYYISYETQYNRAQNSYDDSVHLVIYLNQSERYVLSYLDISLQDQYELEKQTNYDTRPSEFGINTWLRSQISPNFQIRLSPNSFELSYEFITYPCFIGRESGTEHIVLLEGFTSYIKRKWDYKIQNDENSTINIQANWVADFDKRMFERKIQEYYFQQGPNYPLRYKNARQNRVYRARRRLHHARLQRLKNAQEHRSFYPLPKRAMHSCSG